MNRKTGIQALILVARNQKKRESSEGKKVDFLDSKFYGLISWGSHE